MDHEESESTTPFWLTGNWAPTQVEATATSLEVEGRLPPELDGRYLRVGPNPANGSSPHALLGDGMIHGVRLCGGRADWYRNRYVRTPHQANPSSHYFEKFAELDNSLANTHVVGHAGRILALEEAHLPYEVDANLETVGPYDFGGRLAGSMTAHPKICPETGELLFFGYALSPPYLTYHRVSRDGVLLQSEPITVKAATFMHDFNVTRNFVIFMDLPALWGGSLTDGLPIHWSEDYGARLGVMPRDGTDADVRWFDIEPCYVFHPMNAYESGDEIVLDVCRSEYKFKAGAPQSKPRLHRWSIDTRSGNVKETPLDDRAIEFPRVPDDRVGRPYRYGYAFEFDDEIPLVAKRYVKFDMQNGTSVAHDLGGRLGGEAVFVPASGASAEDDGYLLAFTRDLSAQKSELIVLDASQPERDAIARVQIPERVPFGFHGSWIPDAKEGE